MKPAGMGSKRRIRDTYPVRVHNVSSEDAPAGACLYVTGASGVPLNQGQLVTVTQPVAVPRSGEQYLIAGPMGVKAGYRGWAAASGVVPAYYTGTAPAVGTSVGPVAGQWSADTTRSRWRVVGGSEQNTVLVSMSTVGFQLIRGTADANSEIGEDFTISSLVALEADSFVPLTDAGVQDTPLDVVDRPGEAHAAGDTIWAVWLPGTEVWEALPSGSAASPPLRAFELMVDKTHDETSAQVKFLDFVGGSVGAEITVYDPVKRFAGKKAGYVSGETGFIGLAILEPDLSVVTPDSPRWRIVAMERMAEWVTAEYEGEPVNGWVLADVAHNQVGDSWNFRRPVLNGGRLGMIDPAEVLPENPTDGTKILARLFDPDTMEGSTPEPTYMASGGSSDAPYLAKVTDTASAPTYNYTTGEAVPLEIPSLMVSGPAVTFYWYDRDVPAAVDELVMIYPVDGKNIAQYFLPGQWFRNHYSYGPNLLWSSFGSDGLKFTGTGYDAIDQAFAHLSSEDEPKWKEAKLCP